MSKTEIIKQVLAVVLALAESYVSKTESKTDDQILALIASLLNGYISQTEGVAGADLAATIEGLPEVLRGSVAEAIADLARLEND